MPNQVPKKILNDIHNRAGGICEVCKSPYNITPPHHLVKRKNKNHRPEAQVNTCLKCHIIFEKDRSEPGMHNQYRLVLQEFYFEVFQYPEWKVRELMGGRLFIGVVEGENREKAKRHFERVEEYMIRKGQIEREVG